MKILIATEKAFSLLAVKQIRLITETAGYELRLLENYKSTTELLAAVAEADALIVRSDIVNSEVLDAAEKLKIVVRAGAGYDNLDLDACTAHNVVAMNTPGQNSNAVAELVFELMLYQARGGFSGKSGTELRGKTLGIHAFGNVGKFVAEIAGDSAWIHMPMILLFQGNQSGLQVLRFAGGLKNYIQNAITYPFICQPMITP